jgi:hypothetical protein
VVALHQESHFIDLYENAFNQEIKYEIFFYSTHSRKMSAFRKQLCQLHLVALSAALANSISFFLHCTSFVYGSKLVNDGEMTFDGVFRYRMF